MTEAEKLRVKLNVDGGSRGNPGPAAAGVVISTCDDGTVLHSEGIYLGQGTNNIAEYRALIEGLKTAARLNATEVECFSDSELLVKQMNGEYRVKNERLKLLFAETYELVDGFDSFKITHITRQQNIEADRLVNQALNLKRNVEDPLG